MTVNMLRRVFHASLTCCSFERQNECLDIVGRKCVQSTGRRVSLQVKGQKMSQTPHRVIEGLCRSSSFQFEADVVFHCRAKNLWHLPKIDVIGSVVRRIAESWDVSRIPAITRQLSFELVRK